MLETCLNVDMNDGNCLLALAQQFPNEFSELLISNGMCQQSFGKWYWNGLLNGTRSNVHSFGSAVQLRQQLVSMNNLTGQKKSSNSRDQVLMFESLNFRSVECEPFLIRCTGTVGRYSTESFWFARTTKQPSSTSFNVNKQSKSKLYANLCQR